MSKTSVFNLQTLTITGEYIYREITNTSHTQLHLNSPNYLMQRKQILILSLLQAKLLRRSSQQAAAQAGPEAAAKVSVSAKVSCLRCDHSTHSAKAAQRYQLVCAFRIPANLKIDVLFSLLLTGYPCMVKTRRRCDWEFWL